MAWRQGGHSYHQKAGAPGSYSASAGQQGRLTEAGAGGSSKSRTTLAALSAPALRALGNLAEAATRLCSMSAEEHEEWRAQREVCFGQGDVQCVGIRYYTGVVLPGQWVRLVREPRNPYDANAVRVDNLQGRQIGHIARAQALALRPLLDDPCQQPNGLRLHTRVEALFPAGRVAGVYKIRLQLRFYGLPENMEGVKTALIRGGIRITPVGGAGTGGGRGGAGPGGGQSPVVSRQVVTPAQTQKELDDMFDKLSKTDLAGLPFSPKQDAPALATELMPHQRDGVAWLLQRERSGAKLPPFWEERTQQGKKAYVNSITCSSQPMAPPPVLGGILADDMGLGKTIQAIALLLANPPPGVVYRRTETPAGPEAASGEEPQTASPFATMKVKELKAHLAAAGLPTSGKKAVLIARLERGPEVAPQAGSAARGTLIVCPASVAGNWSTQLKEHVQPGALKVVLYLGAVRPPQDEVEQADVVITTYGTLTSDYNEVLAAAGGGQKRKRDSTRCLFDVEWRRVMLDEAHVIRNRATKGHKAALKLTAQHRWCLTGTPVQNKPDDLQALFSFLRCAPLDEFSTWTRAIARPIRNGDATGLSRLRVLSTALALRRTKQLLEGKLPPKTIEVHRLQMPEGGGDRSVYTALFDSARRAFDATVSAGGEDAILRNYSSVLEVLLRLRQACCSHALIPAARVAAARQLLETMGPVGSDGAAGEGPKLSVEEAAQLFAKLKGVLPPVASEAGEEPGSAAAGADPDAGSGDPEECAVCLDPLEAAGARVLRTCRHCFCNDCLEGVIKVSSAGNRPRCPLCRGPFSGADIIDAEQLALELGRQRATTVRDDEGASGGPAGPEPMSGVVEGHVDAGQLGAQDALPPPSPKIAALLMELEAARDRGEKAIVFSQFTSFLDLIGMYIKERQAAGLLAGWGRLDGTMSQKRRAEAMQSFRDDPQVGVLLVSTKAGGQGINLTCANNVFMMDLWWNAAVESQAWDRAHRIGQTKPVRIVRYVCSGSVEERIFALQEKKLALASGSLRRLTNAELRSMRAQDLASIFAADP